MLEGFYKMGKNLPYIHLRPDLAVTIYALIVDESPPPCDNCFMIFPRVKLVFAHSLDVSLR